ncbi:hypothetical protein HNV12_29020 [Methanococcoides sp. SA1]|nr:hypothetical protein [Methanococcoides sp. SA1]
MRRLFVLLILLLLINDLKAQNSPYPIIFVHGLTGSDKSFIETMKFLQKDGFNLGEINVYDAVLNADDDCDFSLLTEDVKWEDFNYKNREIKLGKRNYSDDIDECNDEWSGENIFAINFAEERIRGAYGGWFGDDFFDGSNESAVYKQGYALGKMIEEVLLYTRKEKVILVGHSMGGLAIREYLQRIDFDDPYESHQWWINPYQEDGHKVAKVVTIGTPHRGSNFVKILGKQTKSKSGFPPDYKSEAVRDLRYSYSDSLYGKYLFGGDEYINNTSYHNFDVNCNGKKDIVIGINEGEDGTTFNPEMPLPNNIQYTWITSDDKNIL